MLYANASAYNYNVKEMLANCVNEKDPTKIRLKASFGII
jgi:hypothetical protein